MNNEAELQDKFEDYLENNDHKIKTDEKTDSWRRPDTVAEKAGTIILYEYKFHPQTKDFHRLVYQTFVYETKADKCYIVTNEFDHKVKEIASKVGWGYIVFNNGSSETVLGFNEKKDPDIKHESIKPEECPFSSFLGRHDFYNPEMAKIEPTERKNIFETRVGKYRRKVRIKKVECPYCGKRETKRTVDVKRIDDANHTRFKESNGGD